MSGFDGGDAGGDEDVALAGAGGSDHAQVLRDADPFQGGEVVERAGRGGGGGHVELLESRVDREGGLAESSAPVGLGAGGDLGFDEGAQQLFGLGRP